MVAKTSTNASETQQQTAEETVSEESLTVSPEASDSENDDEFEYDEPRCRWKPASQSEDDCGEGLSCPPCN